MDAPKRTIDDILHEYIEQGSPRSKRWESYDGVLYDGDPAEDTKPDLVFSKSDLVGTLKLERHAFIHKLKTLGLDEQAISQLLLDSDLSASAVELDKRGLVMGLRHLRLYEEAIYEQFHKEFLAQ